MGVHELLSSIQQNLKAPKGQFNDFGKYRYRSCEDILEAVKPLLNGGTLIIGDDLVLIGDRYYVKATVTLQSGIDSIQVAAFAREEHDKKGMDASQITGAASSYARKYALNGLFLIDDTKDADTMDNAKKETKPPLRVVPKEEDVPEFPLPDVKNTSNVAEIATPKQLKAIQIKMREKGFTERAAILDELSAFCDRVLSSSKELSKTEADEWIKIN